MVDGALLKQEIEDLGVKKIVMAEKCGMSRQTLENRLDNPKTILANEIILFADALRIPIESEKFRSIFLAREVEENIHSKE